MRLKRRRSVSKGLGHAVGATQNSAALDSARTICRRAERRVCALSEAGELKNAEIIIYLNRLSDLLWLFARWVETKSNSGEKMKHAQVRQPARVWKSATFQDFRLPRR